MGKVFDDCIRDLSGPSGEATPPFEYLNRSNRVEAERIRQLIEEWATIIPSQHFEKWRADFRSKRSTQHIGAYFELLVAQLYAKSGFDLVNFQPALDGATPDLLIASSEGKEFYVECRTRSGANSDLQKSIFLDSINSFCHTSFRVQLESYHAGPQNISGPKAAAAIHTWLDSLDVEEVRSSFNDASNWGWRRYSRKFTIDGTDFEMIPLPIGEDRSVGGNSRLVGVHGMGVGWCQAKAHIRAEAKKKAKKYQNLDRPLVIALASSESYNIYEDAMEACFGDWQVTVNIETHETKDSLAGNGLFGAPDNGKCEGVIGLLAFQGCTPWNFSSRELAAVLNFGQNHTKYWWGPNVGKIYAKGERVLKETPTKIGQVLGFSDQYPESDI